MNAPRAQCIYLGVFVFCQSRTRLSIVEGCLLVDRDGKIVKLVENSMTRESMEELIRETGWLVEETTVYQANMDEFFFPGFIDTHIHAPQFPNAGVFGKTTLLDWLKTYTYPLEASLSDLQKAKRVYDECVLSTVAHGTTTAAYYATIHVETTKLLASICMERGQRALIGRICMDHPSAMVDYYRDESVEVTKASSLAVIDHIKSLDPIGQHIAPILTPRSAVSCTPEQLIMIRDLALDQAYPIRIQTHLSENLGEMELVRRMWPSHENYTAVYDAHGLLTPRTILAHAIYLDKSEIQLIAARGAKVSHCPVSNSALGSGMCRVRKLMDHDIVVSLGSDVSGGYSPSILEAAKQACLVSRLVAVQIEADHRTRHHQPDQSATVNENAAEWDRVKLTVEEALWMGTRGGAEVVGWQDRIGSFEPGMQFDAQLIAFHALDTKGKPTRDLGNFKIFGWESWEDRVAKWVYCGDDRNTVKVWVDGVLIHQRADR